MNAIIEKLADSMHIPSLFIWIILGILAVVFLIVFFHLSFKYRKFGYFTAMLIEIGAAVLYTIMPQGGVRKLFAVPNLITILLCGLFFAYILNSTIRQTEKNNVLVVGATGRNTRLTKSYYDSVLSGHILSFSRSLLLVYETLIFIAIGLMYGICKVAIVNEFAGASQTASFSLGDILYYALCAIGFLIALVKLCKRKAR